MVLVFRENLKMEKVDFINNCLEHFHKIIKKPEEFLEVNQNLSNNIKTELKAIYDFAKSEEIETSSSSALPELIIKNFDIEQIWQQLELQNDSILPKALIDISKLLVKKKELIFNNLEPEKSEKDSNNENIEDNAVDLEDNQDQLDDAEEDDDKGNDFESEDENNDEEFDENEKDYEESSKEVKVYKKKSVVDDDFFKLEEMEEFLKSEEQRTNDPDSGNDSEEDSENEEDNENIDLFKEDFEEGDNARQAKYKDFFVAKEEYKRERRNKFLEDMIDEENEEFKSTFEKRQERLQQKIGELEKKAISEKPWQLQGEITAENRPYNSLLEEVLEFDLTTRPAPVITEKTTLQLEDIIKQRIKDKVFDSVERKEKPVETLLEYKKKLVLNQEKSKESLAKIYEKEYLDQKANLDPLNEEKEEEEPEAHKEINKLMTDLFSKLDALSNFHFTPKPAVPELKIVSNLPAISMEEVAPVGVSDANLLAPEEVKSKPKGDIIGNGERTKTDKKRERRKKKLKQKVHAKIKAQKEEAAAGKKSSRSNSKNMLNKITKSKNVNKMDESASNKSMKAFFKQLDEETSQTKSKLKIKRKKDAGPYIDAKRMKL